MASGDPNIDVSYSAVYEHGLDDKRRLQIPSKWRLDGWPTDFFLVIWPGDRAGHYIRGLSPLQMTNLKIKLQDMSASDPKTVALRRFIGSQSDRVSLDKVGRVCLPEWLALKAGIGKAAVLVGAIEYFEIWAPDRYGKANAADMGIESEAYGLL